MFNGRRHATDSYHLSSTVINLEYNIQLPAKSPNYVSSPEEGLGSN